MKKLLNLSLIFLSVLIFYSCDSDDPVGNVTPVLSSNFKYPYVINSFWYYTTRNFVTNIRGDSVASLFTTDTTIGYGTSTFTKDTIIYNILTNNYDTLRILKNSHSEQKHSHTTFELYKQTDTGLVRVAAYSGGTNFGPYRQNPNSIKYSFKGNYFYSIESIFSYYNNDKAFDNEDTVFTFDNPPVNCIKYPLTQNMEWLFTVVQNTTFTKIYTDYETVNLVSGNFYCIKMRRLWYLNNSPVPEPNLIHYDYFANEGLVKRDFLIKDIAIHTGTGVLLGYIDVKDEAVLNIYGLP